MTRHEGCNRYHFPAAEVIVQQLRIGQTFTVIVPCFSECCVLRSNRPKEPQSYWLRRVGPEKVAHLRYVKSVNYPDARRALHFRFHPKTRVARRYLSRIGSARSSARNQAANPARRPRTGPSSAWGSSRRSERKVRLPEAVAGADPGPFGDLALPGPPPDCLRPRENVDRRVDRRRGTGWVEVADAE
jgi:hypothetical protein